MTDRRLPARYTLAVTGFFLTAIMTFVISGISTVMALGFTGAALAAWPAAWFTSWIVAFPTVLVVLPLVRRLVSRLVAPA